MTPPGGSWWLALLPAERLAELIEPLDDDTTRKLSEVLAKKQQAAVNEANKRAAMSEEDRKAHDAFNSQVDPEKAKGVSPVWKVDAFRWSKNNRWGGTKWRVDQFPPNYAFTDLSDRSEDWYAPFDGPNWERCLKDKGTAEWVSWPYDPRSGLHIRSQYVSEAAQHGASADHRGRRGLRRTRRCLLLGGGAGHADVVAHPAARLHAERRQWMITALASGSEGPSWARGVVWVGVVWFARLVAVHDHSSC
ncbi:hypothetical protein [Kitasatospora sp. GAS206B]|uniref:hypothetical protein n=1 Tax=unclassified Kitasatospora TaxID=2633591 RepID=UPI003518CA6C